MSDRLANMRRSAKGYALDLRDTHGRHASFKGDSRRRLALLVDSIVHETRPSLYYRRRAAELRWAGRLDLAREFIEGARRLRLQEA